MDTTANLGLPLIAAAQAQKHVTHNEAIVGLDALVQLAVISRSLSAPPGAPAEGDRYIVAAAPTGAWAGHAKHVALWHDGGWTFYPPKAGWVAFVVAESVLISYDGAAWSSGLVTVLQNLALLGVGTTADATNPFSTKLNNVLHTAKGVAEGGSGNIQVKLSKEGAAKTASYLFQTNFSGRAEFGLAGDDDFHVKVSADGAAWTEAIKVDHSTGVVELPVGMSTPSLNGGALAGLRNRIINGGFAINQRAYASGAALAAGAFGHDRWKAGAGGAAYTFVQAPVDTTVTITAGTLQQAVDPANVEGGVYTLSWTGSAQARVGFNGAAPSGAYGASPLAVPSAAAGQTITVEFNAGTLGTVQLEPGTIATPFERRPRTLEMTLCLAYYWATNKASNKGHPVGSYGKMAESHFILGGQTTFPVPMRVAPTLTFWNNGVQNQFRRTADGVAVGGPGYSVFAVGALGLEGFAYIAVGPGPGFVVSAAYDFDIIADAEL